MNRYWILSTVFSVSVEMRVSLFSLCFVNTVGFISWLLLLLLLLIWYYIPEVNPNCSYGIIFIYSCVARSSPVFWFEYSKLWSPSYLISFFNSMNPWALFEILLLEDLSWRESELSSFISLKDHSSVLFSSVWKPLFYIFCLVSWFF